MIVSAAAVAVVFVLLTTGRTRAVRPFAAAAVTAVIWGWGVAQYPYLLPPRSHPAGSAPAASLLSILAIFGIVAATVGPGIVCCSRCAAGQTAPRRRTRRHRGGPARPAGRGRCRRAGRADPATVGGSPPYSRPRATARACANWPSWP